MKALLITISSLIMWVLILLTCHKVAQSSELEIQQYKQNYLVKTHGTTNGTEENNLRFQFSILKNIYRNFNFAYTQRAIWRIYDVSAPVDDFDFNPTLFFSFLNSEIGYEHESNGMAGRESRSWERLFVSYMYKTEFGLSIGYKLWQPFFLHENNEIVEYQGKGELILSFEAGEYFSFENVAREHSNKLMLNFKLARNVAVSVLVFNGYGMNIIEFDKVANWYGIGVSL